LQITLPIMQKCFSKVSENLSTGPTLPSSRVTLPVDVSSSLTEVEAIDDPIALAEAEVVLISQ